MTIKLKKILYISHDGIFDHIGQSQILPYIINNSNHYGFELLSFEKKNNEIHFKKFKKKLQKYGIRWHPQVYHTSLVGKIYDFFKLIILVNYIKIFFNFHLIHCRSYIPSFSIYVLNKIFKYKYIFDIRDFWADEGLEIKKYKFIYKYIKKIEGKMINNAVKIVCLTRAAKVHILSRYSTKFENIFNDKISVIPCGTDFNLFDPSLFKKKQINDLKKKLNIRNRKVLLYYGSVGKNYILNKKTFFFKTINTKNDWFFLFIVNNNLKSLNDSLISNGLKKNDFKILNLKRTSLPLYLSCVDLSIFFYRKGMRSIGCSPTKLADLFAMNIPIITDSNLGDMKSIIKFQKNKSHILNIFNSHHIRNKTSMIVNEKKFINIRKNSNYFNFKLGAQKYLNIYNNLI
ncbi:MAG: hypothetical protein CMK44_00600 [Porticoccus sp.]|nr:hypothetical protein [Porticoccus sp.]